MSQPQNSKTKDLQISANLNDQQKTKAQLKAERKAAFEATRAQKLANEGKKENESNKSKAELKAERRAKQEAQRAAKLSVKQEPNIKTTSNIISNEKNIKATTNIVSNEKFDLTVKSGSNKENESTKSVRKVDPSPKQDDISSEKKLVTDTTGFNVKRGQIFSHLPHKHNDIEQLTLELNSNGTVIHPSVVQIGLRMNKGIIKGSNERCVAMLVVLKKVINDYVTPASKELARDLQLTMCYYVQFLANCRPLSVSMANAVKFLKLNFSKIQPGMSDYDAKQFLCQAIDDFITDEIICAQKGIAVNAMSKINDKDDVILIFGYSLIVKHVLYKAHKTGKKFSVVVVDSRPNFDGKNMLKYLLELDIPTTYIFINAISYVMKEVTKVLLGAHALLANGYVMSNLGSSQIALVANANNIPVIVCCETYKFSERVHTDSFVYNELGDSKELKNPSTEAKSQTQPNSNYLNTLNLVYDVTPPDFVSVVITEIGALPCTSAPAVLRFRETK